MIRYLDDAKQSQAKCTLTTALISNPGHSASITSWGNAIFMHTTDNDFTFPPTNVVVGCDALDVSMAVQ